MKKKSKKAELGKELAPKQLSDILLSSARLTSPQSVNSFNTIQQGDMNKAVMDQFASLQFNPKGSFNYGSLIQPALTALNALIPGDRPDRWKTVQPVPVDNVNANGTGSQAIAKKGKRMKAQFGEELGDPPTKLTYVNTDRSYLSDAVGYSLAQGGNPMNHELGKSLVNQPGGRKLIDAIIAHNSNPAYINSSPDDRINNFYSTVSQDPEIESYKKSARMLAAGSSPSAFYHTSPNVDIQGRTDSKDMLAKLAKMPDGGILGPINFANSYRNSPEFSRRYKINNPLKDPKKAVEEGNKWASIYNPKVVEEAYGSVTTRSAANNILLDKKQAKDLKMSLFNDVLPHEFSHLTNDLTPTDVKKYNTKNRKVDTDMGMLTHDSIPSESHADMNSLRYLMYKEGIYDTRKGDMTKEQLQKAMQHPKIKDQFTFKRMLEHFTPEDIIELNNTVAQNESKGQSIARNGSQLNGDLMVESSSSISEDTLMIQGDSHADGGTMVQYGDNLIEAERGEPLSINSDGSATIWGNLNVPGTKEKFKGVVNKIGKKEAKYDKLQSKGVELLQSNPNSKFGQLALNAGKLMNEGAEMGKQDLAAKKDVLSQLQSALLADSPKKGKNGAILAAQGLKIDPKPLYDKLEAAAYAKLQALYPGKNVRVQGSGSDRGIEQQRGLKAKGLSKTSVSLHNVGGAKDYTLYVDGKPIKDTKVYNQVIQSSAKEVGLFGVGDWDPGHVGAVEEGTGKAFETLLAKHPDLKTGDSYKKTTSFIKNLIDTGRADKQEIQAYNQLTGSKIPLTKGLKKGDASSSLAALPSATDWFGETPFTADPTKPNDPFNLPDVPFSYAPPQSSNVGTPTIPELGKVTVPKERAMPSNIEGLNIAQVLPELYALGKNQVQPVPLQQVNPNLFSPYQVSFQDRLNNNNSTFAALTRQGSENPAFMQGLAANKYQADAQVGAEEFRTNQSLYNDVINRNNALLNDAQMKNLALADQQYVRQQGARDNTDAQNQLILNSVSSKELQNNYENKRLAAYENLYNFRMTDTNNDGINDKASYFGPDAVFGNTGTTPTDQYSRTRSTYIDGLLKSTQVSTPSAKDIEKQQLEIDKKKSVTPKNPIQSFFPSASFRRGKI